MGVAPATALLLLLCHKQQICSIMLSWLLILRRQHHKRNASRHIWTGWRKPRGMLTATSLCGITVPACCWTANAKRRAHGGALGSRSCAKHARVAASFRRSVALERCRHVAASAKLRPACDAEEGTGDGMGCG